MPEHSPKPLSQSKQRKLAHIQAKEGSFHKRTKEAVSEARKAHDRAKYVEEGEVKRFVLGTRGKKYDAHVFVSAPVEQGSDAPEKGGKRRKAARTYSRQHDLSGQIKKEQGRLESLEKQTKDLERGPIMRLLFGTRGKKYDRTLYKEETTKGGIQEALDKVEHEQLPFRPPTPRKIIDITPPAIEEGPPRKTRSYVQPRQFSRVDTEAAYEGVSAPAEGEPESLEEPPDFSAEAHIGRVASGVAAAEEALSANEASALAATRRMVRAEERGFVIDASRTGKIGKNIFWTRIGSFIKGVSIPFALIVAAMGGKAAVDEYNTRPAASRGMGGEGVNPDSSARIQIPPDEAAEVDATEEGGVGGNEDETLYPEEEEGILRQRPEGYAFLDVEEARLRAQAAAEEPVRGLEPPSAP